MITNQIEVMTDTEIDETVANILAMFNDDARDFQLASTMYNSKFFKGLPAAFKKRCCMALRAHFTQQINNYWNEQSENQFI